MAVCYENAQQGIIKHAG